MYSKILVPLDGSARAEAVLTHLRSLLARSDAELTLLAVVDVPAHEQGQMGGARERAAAYLESARSRLGANAVRTRIEIGDPPAEILKVAETGGADLIAMASHGYRGLARLFYGSTAERVLRGSRVPVLVVRSFQGGDEAATEATPIPLEPLRFQRLLVPLDGSQEAEKVLPDAVDLARTAGASIHLLRVRPGFPATPFYAPTPQQLADTGEEEAYLAKVSARLLADGVEVVTAVRAGAVAEHIVSYAADQQVNLLAMTTHGRTGFDRWLLGSVAEEVLRQAALPLLIRRNQ